MRTYWLAFMLVPVAYAQTSSKCADLTKFKIPGVPMVITKAATIPASSGSRNVHRRNIGHIGHHPVALPGRRHDQ